MAYHKNREPLSPEQAVNYALRLLSQRQYSVAKLKEKLLQRQLPEPEADAIIAKLISLQLLDDTRYAEAVTRNEIEFGRKSRWHTKQKLVSKGINKTVIEAAMTHAESLPSESEQIDYHIKKYVNRYGLPESREDTQKLIAKLARRGFSPTEVIKQLKEKKADLSVDENLLE